MYKAYRVILFLIIWSSPLVPADDSTLNPINTDGSLVAHHSPFNLINKDGSPSVPFVALLQETGIEYNGTIEDVLAKTQKSWMRKEGLDRCNVIDIFQDKKEQIFPLLAQIGVINPIDIYPKKECFDYLFVHGGPLNYICSRIALMTTLLNRHKFKTLVLLTGDRPLDAITESEEKILTIPYQYQIDPDWNYQSAKTPTTEYEMNRIMFERAQKPKKWKKAPIKLITTKEPSIERTGLRQVEFVSVGAPDKINTATSILLWLKSKPTEQPCSCLAVSNQPYVGRQDTLAQSLFPKNFKITTVGNRSEEENVTLQLDNLARWLFALKEKQ